MIESFRATVFTRVKTLEAEVRARGEMITALRIEFTSRFDQQDSKTERPSAARSRDTVRRFPLPKAETDLRFA